MWLFCDSQTPSPNIAWCIRLNLNAKDFKCRIHSYTSPYWKSSKCSLGNYLPKRKPDSAYISVFAYISNFSNRPENQCLEKCLVKRLEHRLYMLYKPKCRLYTWRGACPWSSSCLDCNEHSLLIVSLSCSLWYMMQHVRKSYWIECLEEHGVSQRGISVLEKASLFKD